jgi:hypothetical protein
MRIHFLLSLLASIAVSGQAFAAALPSGLIDQVQAAEDQATSALDQGNFVASSILQGQWTTGQRMCVTGLTPSELANPQSVLPPDGYTSTWTFNGSSGTFDAAFGSECIAVTEFTYSSMPLQLTIPGTSLTFVQGIANLQGQTTSSCGYTWTIADQSAVIQIDNDNVYFFMTAEQLAATEQACSPGTYQVHSWTRVNANNR